MLVLDIGRSWFLFISTILYSQARWLHKLNSWLSCGYFGLTDSQTTALLSLQISKRSGQLLDRILLLPQHIQHLLSGWGRWYGIMLEVRQGKNVASWCTFFAAFVFFLWPSQHSYVHQENLLWYVHRQFSLYISTTVHLHNSQCLHRTQFNNSHKQCIDLLLCCVANGLIEL